MTKLLSIDSSTSATGYAVFINGKYTRSGCIDLKKTRDINQRFPEMIERIQYLLNSEDPDIVVVEEMVVTRNAQAARNLTMILGAIYGKCLENEIHYCSMRPTVWRKYIDTGAKPRKREELKEWSKQKAKEIFGLDDISDDVSDAILIGQAFINMMNDIGGN